MNITPCLLSSDNTARVQGVSLGARIAESGRAFLWEERSGARVDTVVIHYISSAETCGDNPFDLEAVLKIFVDFGVSAHYLIDRQGVVRQLVPDQKKAWHCGGSIMPPPDSREGVNDFSIGIEIIATAASGFTDEQYESCAALCSMLEQHLGPLAYVGHENIAGKRAVQAGLRTDIKIDPGPLFDWPRFSRLRASV